MFRALVISILILSSQILFAADKVNVYLFPGQGSDHRIFKNFDLDTTSYNYFCIDYGAPLPKENLRQFACRQSKKIDTLDPFILVGVSLGGMICVEMAHFLNPEKVFILSSAKNSLELPTRYTFQKKVGFYKLLSPRFYKFSAQLLQPIVEPDRSFEKETCKSMLKIKSEIYFKRTVSIIVEWGRKSCNAAVIHIHGDNDHTIPIRNVKSDYIVKGGSHMMALTHGSLISEIIFEEMNKTYWN